MTITDDALTPEQRRVLREGATQAPFTGRYLDHHEDGIYACVGCGASLFASNAKFDSGTGWPSFDTALPGAVTMTEDLSHGMRRVEVRCAGCGGHLGHVFSDGPTQTGERFCMNDCVLQFKKPLV